jgi:hypothetical protein
MIGLIVAVSVIGAVLISAIVVGAIKIYRMDKNLNNLAECFLAYITKPEEVDIIEEYSVKKKSGKDFGFPNSEGF